MTTPIDTRPVAIFGATGQQGGAVIDPLLAAGRPIRAIVRDPGSPKALALSGRGIEVVPGDQDDPESLLAALTDVSAVFLMTTYTDATGTAGELRRGIAFADVAARAGVPRVVYSSVGGAERHSGVPHFESKYQIERHLESVLPTQIVRPTFFMENFTRQLGTGGAGEFVFRQPLPDYVALQMISVRDVGAVVAAALIDAQALDHGAIEIAGDQLTGPQIASRIGAHLGRPARYEQLPLTVIKDDDLHAMFRWFTDTPSYQADFARTRSLDPDVLDLAGWLALH